MYLPVYVSTSVFLFLQFQTFQTWATYSQITTQNNKVIHAMRCILTTLLTLCSYTTLFSYTQLIYNTCTHLTMYSLLFYDYS